MLSSFESSFLKILNIYGSRVCPRNEHISIQIGESTPTGGGGGTRIIYCIRGLRCGHSPKGGGGCLRYCRSAKKNGGLRYWHSAKNGGLRCGHNQKEGGGVLVAAYKPDIGFVKGKGLIGTEVGQKGVLGAYLFIIFILLTGGGVFWQT